MFQPRPGMGDLIWHLPVIRAIAAVSAERRVTLITKPSTQADILLRHDPAIGRIVWFDRNPRQGRGRHDGVFGYPRLVAGLRGCRADTCVLLHHGASLAAAMFLAGMPHRYGYGYDRVQRRWLNHGPFLGPDVQFSEAFDQANAFAHAAGFLELPEPSLQVDAAARARLAARMNRLPKPWAVLGVGCHGETRQWGAGRFAALADALLARGAGTVLLLAATHEAALVRDIEDRVTQTAGVHGAVGWKLDEVVALLSEAELFIGNDSGLMNVRAALGRPAYALFGASGPLRHSAQIHPIVPPSGPRSGMAGITVEQVLEALA